MKHLNGERWKAMAQEAGSTIAMIRGMIGEMFGPIASIESEEATLLRGPTSKHDGEAILAALQRIAFYISMNEPDKDKRIAKLEAALIEIKNFNLCDDVKYDAAPRFKFIAKEALKETK